MNRAQVFSHLKMLHNLGMFAHKKGVKSNFSSDNYTRKYILETNTKFQNRIRFVYGPLVSSFHTCLLCVSFHASFRLPAFSICFSHSHKLRRKLQRFLFQRQNDHACFFAFAFPQAAYGRMAVLLVHLIYQRHACHSVSFKFHVNSLLTILERSSSSVALKKNMQITNPSSASSHWVSASFD